jgi:hypothetical protein
VPDSARSEITNLVDQLVRPEAERSAEAQSYLRALPRKAQKALEKVWGTKRPTLPPGFLGGGAAAASSTGAQAAHHDVAGWLGDLQRTMQRAALVASGDLGACARVFARHASGGLISDFDLVGEAVLALDRGPAIGELVVFYLSEQYNTLRATLGDAVP